MQISRSLSPCFNSAVRDKWNSEQAGTEIEQQAEKNVAHTHFYA